jgi:hypothetical protein
MALIMKKYHYCGMDCEDYVKHLEIKHVTLYGIIWLRWKID